MNGHWREGGREKEEEIENEREKVHDADFNYHGSLNYYYLSALTSKMIDNGLHYKKYYYFYILPAQQ